MSSFLKRKTWQEKSPVPNVTWEWNLSAPRYQLKPSQENKQAWGPPWTSVTVSSWRHAFPHSLIEPDGNPVDCRSTLHPLAVSWVKPPWWLRDNAKRFWTVALTPRKGFTAFTFSILIYFMRSFIGHFQILNWIQWYFSWTVVLFFKNFILWFSFPKASSPGPNLSIFWNSR